MAPDAVAHFPRQVQPLFIGPVPGAAVLQDLHRAQALRVVPEPSVDRHRLVQGLLARVPERRVAEVMPQDDRLGQVLVQPDRPRDRPRDLRHLQGVGQARPVVIAFGRDEHLRLVHQAAEGLRVDDAVPVALELRPKGVGR